MIKYTGDSFVFQWRSIFVSSSENFSVFEISRSDTLRFRSIVLDVMTEACTLDGNDTFDGIGTLGEKQMHAAIKRFICPDTDKHEIKLDSFEKCIKNASLRDNNEEKKPKRRRFVADILNENNIYEIQTGALAPLREKIRWVLENTEYNITVIHPIAEKKWVNIIGAKSGDIEKRYLSPLKGKIFDIAPELYYIREFISSPRFCLVILMMEAEQYIKNVSKTPNSRKKYKKYELIPINLLRAYIFHSADDYNILIPEALPDKFTVKEYSRLSKIRGIDAYSSVHSLCELGLLSECGKQGKAALYKKQKNEI